MWLTPLTTGSNKRLAVAAVGVDPHGVVTLQNTIQNLSTLAMDFLTIRYSATSTELWRNRFNGVGNGADNVGALTIDGQDAALVTGASTTGTFSSATDMVTLKFPAGLAPSSTAPAAPSNLTASSVSNSQIQLSWGGQCQRRDRSPGRALQGRRLADFTEIAVVGANAISFVDVGLAHQDVPAGQIDGGDLAVPQYGHGDDPPLVTTLPSQPHAASQRECGPMWMVFFFFCRSR